MPHQTFIVQAHTMKDIVPGILTYSPSDLGAGYNISGQLPVGEILSAKALKMHFLNTFRFWSVEMEYPDTEAVDDSSMRRISQEKIGLHILEVLIHYNRSSAPWPWHDSPAAIRSREALLAIGMIEPMKINSIESSVSFQTTERGRQWLEAICNTPCPPDK